MLKLLIGLVIAVAAWVPLSMADPRDIAFQAAILGVFGTVIGAIIALVGLVQCVRRGSAPQ